PTRSTLLPYTPLFRSPRPRVARAVKNAVQPVVILGRDRIELMIVTAGATDRHSKECTPQVVDRVFDRQMLRIIRHPRAEPPGVRSEEHTSELQSREKL